MTRQTRDGVRIRKELYGIDVPDADAGVAINLLDLESRLMRVLQLMTGSPGRWILIISFGKYYVQFLAPEEGGLIAECVSNAYQPEGAGLSLEQEELLPELGWGWPAPPDHLNWHAVEWESDSYTDLAALGIQTLRRVFGCLDDDALTVKFFHSSHGRDPVDVDTWPKPVRPMRTRPPLEGPEQDRDAIRHDRFEVRRFVSDRTITPRAVDAAIALESGWRLTDSSEVYPTLDVLLDANPALTTIHVSDGRTEIDCRYLLAGDIARRLSVDDADAAANFDVSDCVALEGCTVVDLGCILNEASWPYYVGKPAPLFVPGSYCAFAEDIASITFGETGWGERLWAWLGIYNVWSSLTDEGGDADASYVYRSEAGDKIEAASFFGRSELLVSLRQFNLKSSVLTIEEIVAAANLATDMTGLDVEITVNGELLELHDGRWVAARESD